MYIVVKRYQVQSSSDTGEFIVNADVMTFVFKQKLHPTGRKSKHYAVDMDDYPVSVSESIRESSNIQQERDRRLPQGKGDSPRSFFHRRCYQLHQLGRSKLFHHNTGWSRR